MSLFNESKRHESDIKRFQSEASPANIAVEKMRDKLIRLRSKNYDLHDERSQLRHQQEVDHLDSEINDREPKVLIVPP
jgi:phage shock protein A